MSTTPVTGQPFTTALRIEVAEVPQRAGDVRIAAPVDAAIARGDVLMVSFWMRSITPGEATLDAGLRGSGGGFRGMPQLEHASLGGNGMEEGRVPPS
jgi:hypothetical protein